uniref:Uncharacterized protein n=1 Tax=candidate division WOR-3 bacterium TaxID=2052148 RepID=A0A7V3ZU70_UNCW3
MANIILIIDKKNDFYKRFLDYFKKDKKKLILLAFPEKEEKGEYWHFLFSLGEKLQKEKISFSIGLEEGSLFSLLDLVKTISCEIVILPKSKFLLLGEEYDDFLKELNCPLLIY